MGHFYNTLGGESDERHGNIVAPSRWICVIILYQLEVFLSPVSGGSRRWLLVGQPHGIHDLQFHLQHDLLIVGVISEVVLLGRIGCKQE